jgi:hypothetical protein
MTEPKLCKNCAYFAKPDEYLMNLTRGECRRYAPRPLLNDSSDIDARPLWPYVLSDEGCGEFSSEVAYDHNNGATQLAAIAKAAVLIAETLSRLDDPKVREHASDDATHVEDLIYTGAPASMLRARATQ